MVCGTRSTSPTALPRHISFLFVLHNGLRAELGIPAAWATLPQKKGTLGASSPELCVPILLSPFLASCRICIGLSLSLLTANTSCHTQPHGASYTSRTHTHCAHTDALVSVSANTLCTHICTVRTHSANTDTLHTHRQFIHTQGAHTNTTHTHLVCTDTVHTHAQLAHALRIHAVLTRRAHSSHTTHPRDKLHTQRARADHAYSPTLHTHARAH